MAVSGEYRGVMRAIMIVSGESKMGQMHSRPRSRRPPDVAHFCEMVAESNPVSSAAIRGMTSVPILVDDEDDDVVVSSPRSYAQVWSKSSFHRLQDEPVHDRRSHMFTRLEEAWLEP